MTRRIRTALLGVAAALVLVAAPAGPSQAAHHDGAPATHTAVAAARHSVTDRAARTGSAQNARPATGQPKPVLVPRSTPYRRTGSSAVALTFDDGPDPRWTPQVLAQLRKRHVKATFCLIGVNVKAHPDLVRRIAADGHTLCNHTMHHDLKLKTRSRTAILADLRATSALITKASGGVKPTYFRAPGGNWSGVIVSVARTLGMASLGWGVDPRDWAKPPASTIVSRVRAGVAPGVIVLMHDGGGDRSRSIAALKVLLPELTSHYRLTRL